MKAEATADDAFVEMKPLLKEIDRLIATAPLSGHERLGLALMLASHAMGTAMAVMSQENEEVAHMQMHELARPTADLIVGLLESRAEGQRQ